MVTAFLQRTIHPKTNQTVNSNQPAQLTPVPKQTKAQIAAQKREAKLLAQDLRDCLCGLRKNEMLFNLETEEALIDQRIYERRALECRYRYLLGQARVLGLRMQLQRGGY